MNLKYNDKVKYTSEDWFFKDVICVIKNRNNGSLGDKSYLIIPEGSHPSECFWVPEKLLTNTKVEG